MSAKNCLWANRFVAPAFLLPWLLVQCSATAADLNSVLKQLRTGSPDLERVCITAVETSTWYPATSVEHPAFKGRPQPVPSSSSAPIEKEYVYTYQFEPGAVLVTQVDRAWKEEPAQRILVIDELLFIAHSARKETSGLEIVRTGEILPRPPGGPVGCPQFLTKGMLADWLSKTAGVEEISPGTNAGYLCYSIPNPSPAAPGSFHNLYIPSTKGEPILLKLFLSDGSLYSSSEVVFAETGIFSRAQTITYSAGAVQLKKMLTFAALDASPSPIVRTEEDFFAPGTLVNDSRGASRVSYRVGTRIATVPEVKDMAKSKQGIAKYEAITHTKADLKSYAETTATQAKQQKSRTGVARMVLLTFVVLSGAALWWFQRKNKRAS